MKNLIEEYTHILIIAFILSLMFLFLVIIWRLLT